MTNNPLLQNGSVRLKVCRYGPMLYLSSDEFIGRSLDHYGEFCEGEAEVLRQIVRPGATVVEVGANIGAHTICLAKAAGITGRVFAFEPQRFVYQMLCGNVALNALTNVHTHRAAVGRAPATLKIPALDPQAVQNFGSVSLAFGDWPEGEPVPVVTIDSLQLSACQLIKIDVEGMELDVLQGAQETVQRFRPVIYTENSWEDKSEALIRQLLAWNYRLYWHFPPLFTPANYFQHPQQVFGNVVSLNMLCIHASFDQSLLGFREITDPTETVTAALASHDMKDVVGGH